MRHAADHPAAREDAWQLPFAAALLEPDLPVPPGLRAWNGSDPGRRFAVYRNNVIASLVDALAQTFPVVQALVGDEFFRAMAAVFVRQSPPRSPVLLRHGAAFPDFVAGFPPAAPLPWLADVARLELARVEAYHAADAEPLAPEAITRALAAGERIGELCPRPHPSLRLVRSPYPVASIWAAHQGQGALEEVDLASGECALVLRPRLDVVVLPCDEATFAFAEAMQQGRSFAASAEAAASAGGALPAVLSTLLAHAVLVAIHHPAGSKP